MQSSSYAQLAGVPVALLGLIGYAAIGASLAVPGEAGRSAGALLALVGAGFSLSGFSLSGFSLYLTWLELFEIEAVCPWCVASGVVMIGLAIVSVARALR